MSESIDTRRRTLLAGASAVAVVMLLISFGILLAIGGVRFLATRHERA